MVSILFLIFSCSCLPYKLLETVPNHSQPHVPQLFQVRKDPTICLFFLYFQSEVDRNDKIYEMIIIFVNAFWIRSFTEIRWSVCILKYQRILGVSFLWTDSCSDIHYLVLRSKFNLLHNSQWIIFSTQSFLSCLLFC